MQKKLPKISICTPNYNDGKTIGSYIDSIFDQDYPEIEMIICDDGSTDNSKKVLEKKQKKYKNLRVIFSRHKGACVARNLAAKEATGKYISFLPADSIVFPGVIRTWVNHLEDNPDMDFLYGGYRFVEEDTRKTVFDYLSEPFDPYFLNVANYIDGSFPLKKELFDKMGGWDSSIKSLQDWDFWLNAVINHGAKGMYLPEIFFETTMPHEGGLSDDSSKNWIDRTTQIKNKYGIKENDICVCSKGAEFHGKRVAKVLGADYKFSPEFKPHNHKLIYLLGFYPNVADKCATAFAYHNGLRVIHWIGTDVWQLLQQSTHHKGLLIEWFKSNIDVHLTEFETTRKELANEGIKSKVVPIPPGRFYDVTPLPKKFTVAVYMPQQNKGFYFPEQIKDIAKNCRNMEFKLFGDNKEAGRVGNIEYMGRLNEDEMAKLISESSCLLRLVQHDGLSISVEEFISAGRRIVTNISGIKYARQCKLTKDSVIDNLKEIQNEKKPDTVASKYWRRLLSPTKYKKFFDDLLVYDIKDYWEKRSETWESSLGDSTYKPDDEKKVMKELKAMNPKSIIDVGCGNGNWAKIIYKELPNVEYLGVDISKRMVGYAKKRMPNKEFKVMDVRKPKLDKKYDVAFMYTCLMHVPVDEMEATVKEMKKIANRVLLIEPIKEAPRMPHRFLGEQDIKAIENGYMLYHPKAVNIHNYDDYFNIVKRKDLKERELMIIKL